MLFREAALSLLVGSGVLVVACAGANPARDEIERRNGAVSAPVAGWTCPMHPDVHATEPGPCPKCGMPLVRAGG